MSLDPMPSAAQLLAMKAEREQRARLPMQIVENGVVVGEMVARPSRVLVALDYAVRDGDRLRLELPFPPRTKKNHGQAFGIRQSKGYTRFREQVKDHVGRMKDALALPLPDAVDFNAAARFYVDNDAADTVGLMQGLADALQDAGVIPNDRQLRTWNGTDQELDKVRPRVELLLTPILRP